MKPIKLARVHFATDLGAHDPAHDCAPCPETRRTIFAAPVHDIVLADGVLTIRHAESGRTTLVPWPRASEAVPESKS